MIENTRKGFGLIKVNPLFNLLCIGSCSSAELGEHGWGRSKENVFLLAPRKLIFTNILYPTAKGCPTAHN